MHKFKGILVQLVQATQEDRGVSYFTSDGIFEFDITADNEYQATCKMLDYFYETYWFCNKEEDTPIEVFKSLTEYGKVEALNSAQCVFEYIVYYNPDKVKTIKVKL